MVFPTLAACGSCGHVKLLIDFGKARAAVRGDSGASGSQGIGARMAPRCLRRRAAPACFLSQGKGSGGGALHCSAGGHTGFSPSVWGNACVLGPPLVAAASR